VAREWVIANRSPAVDPAGAKRFLDSWRRSYLAELPRWRWWRLHFGEIAKYMIAKMKVEPDLTDIAIGNVAVCEMERPDSGRGLADLCNQQIYPLLDLLDILRPKVILASGVTLRKGEGLIPSSWNGLVRAWPAARPDSARNGQGNWRWIVAKDAIDAM
jgi:hypothetical protein